MEGSKEMFSLINVSKAKIVEEKTEAEYVPEPEVEEPRATEIIKEKSETNEKNEAESKINVEIAGPTADVVFKYPEFSIKSGFDKYHEVFKDQFKQLKRARNLAFWKWQDVIDLVSDSDESEADASQEDEDIPMPRIKRQRQNQVSVVSRNRVVTLSDETDEDQADED